MDAPRIGLTSYEVVIFVAYLLLTVAVGFFVGRNGRRDPRDYFMGDRRLPWYVVIAYKLFPHLMRPDQSYILLVESLVPPGLRGLILAAIAGALMSHLSAMINSTSTILTMDLYKRLLRPTANEHALVVFAALVLPCLEAEQPEKGRNRRAGTTA